MDVDEISDCDKECIDCDEQLNNSDEEEQYDHVSEGDDVEFENFEVSRDDAKTVFSGHEDSLMCVIFNKVGNVIISGGMDDAVIVWKVNTGERLCENRTAHADTVTHLGLSKSDKILASGDMEGNVILWKIKPDPFRLEELFRVELTGEVVGLQWINETLCLCDKTGAVQLIENKTVTAYVPGKGCCCVAMRVVLDDKFVAIVYGGECELHTNCTNCFEIVLLDLCKQSLSSKLDLSRFVSSEVGCSNPDFAAAVTSKKSSGGGGELLAVADGTQLLLAAVTDAGKWHPVQRVSLPKEVAQSGSVLTLAFCDSMPLLALSTQTGLCVTYDHGRCFFRQPWLHGDEEQQQSEEGVASTESTQLQRRLTDMRWLSGSPMLLTVSEDAQLRLWDGRKPLQKSSPAKIGHSAAIWTVAMFVTGSSVAVVTGSEDKTCRLFTFDL